jgi:hypothetical protein
VNEFPSLQYLQREFTRLETEALRAAPAAVRRQRRRRLSGVLVAAAVGLVLIVTPAGAAIVDWIGDLIGIGDSPSRSEQTGEPAVVIGVGTSPAGGSFELVATGRVPGGLAQSTTCLSIDAAPGPATPSGDPLAAASCLTDDAIAEVEANGITTSAGTVPTSLAPPRSILVEGLVTAAARRVDVEYGSDGRHGKTPVTLAELTPELAAQIDLQEEVGYYVAFVPAQALGPHPGAGDVAAVVSSIRARALGPGREVLGSAEPTPTSIVAISHELGLDGPHPAGAGD